MAPRSNTPHDKQLGAQLRLQRRISGFSQDALASQLGISYQQLQKYETGENRISAIRLWRVAHILDIPLSAFHEKAEEQPPKRPAPKMSDIDARFIQTYTALAPAMRMHLRALAEALASAPAKQQEEQSDI